MGRVSFFAGLGLAVLLSSCGAATGTLGPMGYEQPFYGYKLSYQDPARQLFIGPDWAIDNYYYDSEGWSPKRGKEYEATRSIDLDGDGIISAGEREREPIYDLRLVNRRDDGVIWVKAHPLAPRDSAKDLDVMLNAYVEGLSGTGLFAQSNLFSVERIRARQFTTFVTAKEAIKIGGNDALAWTVELADTDRLRLDPASRTSKLKIVFMRFNAYRPAMDTVDSKWATVFNEGAPYTVRPALFVAGYENTTSKFEEHRAEFDRLLAHLSFSPGVANPGSVLTASPAPAAPAQPAPARLFPQTPTAP